MTVRILHGDALGQLQTLADESVQCVVTSPPYFGLRDYGTGKWDGGADDCEHIEHRGPPLNKSTLTSAGIGATPDGAASKAHAKKFRNKCGKCGAIRIDRQIGLESTPAEYVAKMVAVFREVRRVLRKDGVCWLNIGDSYFSATATQGRNEDKAVGNVNMGGSLSRPNKDAHKVSTMGASTYRRTAEGLKPKDICGMPWRLAFALQQPYYTGRIKSEADRIWLAAMIDAEGCLFIHKRKAGQHNGQGYFRQNDSYGPGLEVANTSLAVVERCQQITGLGSICSQSPEQNDRRKQTIYRWNLRTIECRDVIREIYPFLVAKHQQARILCGCPPSGEKAEAAHAALIGLHRGTLTDVDFDAPASMFEPGWYLRQDVIWKKSNPMPESVTDRCTKAHEYVFLLSKSERYFYDASAIAEPFADERMGNPGAYKAKLATCETPGGIHGLGVTGNGWNADATTTTRNKRSVWTITTEPYPEAHFATFPTELPRICILAGSKIGDTILDPFAGSGTTLQVALELSRAAIGIELNAEYVALANRRLNGTTLGLPLEIAA